MHRERGRGSKGSVTHTWIIGTGAPSSTPFFTLDTPITDQDLSTLISIPYSFGNPNRLFIALSQVSGVSQQSYIWSVTDVP